MGVPRRESRRSRYGSAAACIQIVNSSTGTGSPRCSFTYEAIRRASAMRPTCTRAGATIQTNRLNLSSRIVTPVRAVSSLETWMIDRGIAGDMTDS